jgi:hypothetical protein
MKQIFKQIVISAVTLLACISASAYDFEVDGVYYNLTNITENKCVVVGGDINKIGETLKIPSFVTHKNKSLQVTGIENRAFSKSEIKHLIIEEGVSYIGRSAFYSSSKLESVEIKGPLTLYSGSFDWCYNLSIFIAPLLQSFDSGCFRHTKLTEFKIPETMTKIPASSFEYSNIQNIEIPSSITKIEAGAFHECRNLKNIVIPSSITAIEEGAFSECNIEKLIIENSEKPLTLYPSFYESFKSASDYDETIIHGSFFNTKILSFENTGRRLNVKDRENKLISDYSPSYPNSYSPIDGERFRFEFPIKLQSELIIGNDPGYSIDNYYIRNWVEYQNSPSHASRSIVKRPIFKHEDSFERIIVKSEIPPVFTEDPRFENKDYINWTIVVPYGTKTAYENAPIWKNFWNIEEMKSSRILDMQSGSSRMETGRFDVNGNRVNEDFKGITIVKFSDGSTKKFINRR